MLFSSAIRQVSGRKMSPAVSVLSQRWISKSSEVDALAKGAGQQQQPDQATASTKIDKLHKGTTLRHKKHFRFVLSMKSARLFIEPLDRLGGWPSKLCFQLNNTPYRSN